MAQNQTDPQRLTFYPFAYALLDEELDHHCWFCLLPPTETGVVLKQCGKCRVAKFCGRDCQQLGWNDHRAECKALLNGPIPIEVRMLVRIAVRTKQIRDGKDQDEHFYYKRSSRRSIMDIWSHSDDMRNDPKAIEKFNDIYSQLTQRYSDTKLLDREEIFQLHCRNFINRHAISDRSYLKEIGKGLYLDLCAYDHSCRPNTIYTCEGFVATLVGLNPTHDISNIPKTFYTYIDLLNCKEDRQEMLKESWYFHCQCERCLDESDNLLTAIKCPACDGPVVVPRRKDIQADLSYPCRNCQAGCSPMRIIDGVSAMENIRAFVDKNTFYTASKPENLEFLHRLKAHVQPMLHTANIWYIRVIQAIIVNSDHSSDNSRVLLDLHLEALECMRLCYPVNHPALAYHLMNIGIFHCQLDSPKSAKPFLQEAVWMFRIALGPQHSFSLRTESFLNDLS